MSDRSSMNDSKQEWSTSSWRSKPVAQDVVYPDAENLSTVLQQLKSLPGLVTPTEVDRLRKQLADVADGKSFLLQSGDCAELFSYCNPTQIEAKLKLSLLMSLIIIWGARVPVVRLGRVAGQYAKPRSKATEVVDFDGEKKEVLTFRGDNVNGFDVRDRKPDPERLLKAYFHSSATLNHIRASLSSGFADLHAPMSWSFSHVRSPALQAEFERIVESLTDALDFMKTVGADPESRSESGSSLSSVDYYISHEGLMLEYEEALTRVQKPSSKGLHSNSSAEREERTPSEVPYVLSAHTIWLGDRTRQLDGAHIEFFRGIRNPVGIKVGPSMKPDELVKLLDVIDPRCERGRVTLIGRYGAKNVDALLPAHIRAVNASSHAQSVIWCCDPMHGNTTSSPSNPSVKTRLFSDIVTELASALRIHQSLGSRLGGVHLELTGDMDENGFSVTECVGGSMQLQDRDLARNYQSHCDPRLNYEQSLDIAFLISHFLRGQRLGKTSGAFSPAPASTLVNDQAGGSPNEEQDQILSELVKGISARP
ncbi:DAHP synthetase [Tilletiaria anomala UBC 951]|uniref:Phospho-2-dehydro-3-deoxyheptonate aldolase n=1 Tax=Tilletiaria anomala (strain ATCC 24038 / CBS 436.72 / UBC 951) TaxID=1037660 RepID=A0A066WNM0_TILAU|nr:DAHP synthetase [Tilletiaria anomala UBC 951]KDN52215.1 DAHP synthetase [Tilletiaria anomala UBC 951]